MQTRAHAMHKKGTAQQREPHSDAKARAHIRARAPSRGGAPKRAAALGSGGQRFADTRAQPHKDEHR